MTVLLVLLTHGLAVFGLAVLAWGGVRGALSGTTGQEQLIRSLALVTGFIGYLNLRTLGLTLPIWLIPGPDQSLSIGRFFAWVFLPAAVGIAWRG